MWIWIPVLLIGYWGYAYLRACVLTLFASSGPIQYIMSSKAGPLTLRAESFQVDLDKNYIHLNRASATTASGQILARVNSANIVGAIPEHLTGPSTPIQATVDIVSGTLRRLPSGVFEIQDYLPETSTATSKVPYTIRVSKAHLALVDERGTTKWRDPADARNILVQGIGSTWDAFGRVNLHQLGVVSAEVRRDPARGLSIDARTRNCELAQLFRHVMSGPDLRKAPFLNGVSAQSFLVNGPVQVFVPQKGNINFQGNVVADAREFVYRDEFVVPVAHFEGTLTHAGLRGVLITRSPGVSATYTGALSWGKEVAVGGALAAKIDKIGDAPKFLQRLLPKSVVFENANFDGWLDYSSGHAVGISGRLDASTAQYRQEKVVQPQLDLDASTQRVALSLTAGNWNGSPVHGALNYTPKTKSLDGLIVANGVALTTVGKRFGFRNVYGNSNVEALISGPAAQPAVSIRATGNASTIAKGRRFNLGEIVAAADFAGNQLQIKRLSVNGPDGVLTAVGTWNAKTNGLNVDVVGSGIPLNAFTADISGRAALAARVSGTTKDPLIKGRTEVFNATVQDQNIPLLMADITADRNILSATHVELIRNAARASGDLTYNLKTGALAGAAEANDIDLSDLVGKTVAGTASVSNVKVSGTLKHMVLSGQFNANNIVADDVRVDEVKGELTMNGGQTRLQGVASFDNGQITATGMYDAASHVATINGLAESLALDNLTPQLPADTTLGGLVNGAFNARFANGKLLLASAKGNLQNVSVNGVSLGAGPFLVTNTGNEWGGSLSVGELDRYLEILNAQYDASKRTAHAELDAHAVPLQDLYATLAPYIATPEDSADKRASALAILPVATVNDIRQIDGSVDTTLTLDGNLKSPNLSIPTLAINNLNLSGQPSGQVSASATVTNGVWDITKLLWTGGPGTVSMSGTVAEHGAADLNGEINNLNPNWLAMFSTGLEKFTGQSDVSFSVHGPSAKPTIQASLSYSEGNQAINRRQLQVLATVQPGSITAQGEYYYNGFTGPLEANIPFEYPFTIPKDRPVTASATLPPRPIQDLSYLIPWMDAKRSTGTVSGKVALSGPASKLSVTGSVVMSAPTFAANGVDTSLQNVNAGVVFNGNSLVANAKAAGSNGGNISVNNAKVNLDNVSDVFSQSLDTLLANAVSGGMSIDNFKLVQKGSTPINTTLAGNINFSGPLRRPEVKGAVSVLGGNFSVPAAPSEGSAAIESQINPQFNVSFAMPNPVTVNAGLGTFQLTGNGSMAGSLVLPNFNAELLVDKGNIRLPNARINIDPGGTIHLLYQGTPYGTPIERSDVDLTGSTSFTANPYASVIQRYDITLGVRGDLLASNALQITAQSDPPDLTQDQILTILGQGGLFAQNAANAATPYRPNEQLQTAVFTALPLLFDPLTRQLASGLGLDYLNIEYNQFEKISITGAKSLSKTLVLSARRQLSPPVPGMKQSYDIRLSWRLPLKGKLRNLNLSVGANQDAPWRIALEYGFRF